MGEPLIILFDGVCNFCNASVLFVIKRNKKKDIFFAPIQSIAGEAILKRYGQPVNIMRSFIFIENGKAYNKSTAVLRVCRHMRAIWPLTYGFIIVPKFIRDGIYDFIAGRRYKWFGKRQQCMIPTPELKARFLN